MRSSPHGPWPSALLGVLLLLAAAGCAEAPPEAVDPGDVPPPPSIRAETEAGPALVTLNERQAADLGIRTATVVRTEQPTVLSLPGEVHPDPEHFALVGAPIGGRVARIYAHEGEAVRRGAVLLELESLAFADLVADYLQAQAEAVYQEAQAERLRLLVERKISPRSKLEKAEADLSRARSMVNASYARLRAVGVPEDAVEQWATAGRVRPLLPVHAPLSGIIDRHDIEPGQSVTANEEMLSLLDPSYVLVRGFVAPEEAASLQPGDAVTIQKRFRPDQRLTARVTTINPALSPDNKSVMVNVRARTKAGWPIVGEQVQLQVSSRRTEAVLSIPLSAVQYEGERPTVFVRRDARTYEKRFIEIDRMLEDTVFVASGLAEGEAVAVTLVFNLKALSRQALYGEE